MLNDKDPVSFVATCNPIESRTFYETRLGLTLVTDEYFALVFDLNGHMLRIAKLDKFVAADHTVLGWHVHDIVDTIACLAERGVVFEKYAGMSQDESGIWVSPSGAKVAWLKDPDGNVLSLTQIPGYSAT